MLKWSRRDRVDGDPYWFAAAGEFLLTVRVECPCIWAWEVAVGGSGEEMARGTICIDDVEDDQWDYQHVDRPQRRAELVALALAQPLREPDSG